MMVANCLDSTDPTNKFAHTLYYVQDALYSTRALVAAKGWVIEEQTAYDVYGKPTTWTAGDANADGDIDSDDLALLQASWYKYECDSAYNWRCDFDNSGKVSGTDALAISNRSSSTPAHEQSFFTNPYYFTGRRVDILDNGSLKIQYNRNRYYDYYTGRWLTHDPLGYVEGINRYEYAESNPTQLLDPNGTDIYLEAGKKGHLDVCVDLWKCSDVPGVEPIRIGEVCFSFGAKGFGWAAPSTTWLGWSSLNAGGPLRGQIYLSGYVETEGCLPYSGHIRRVIRRKRTTVLQDIQWATWMLSTRLGTEDTYSVLRHNCRMYSQKEFDDAPGTLY
jgi:RHS repeat-associated protein